MAIEGLKVIPLDVHRDDRGYLFELIHNYDLDGGSPEIPKLREVIHGDASPGDVHPSIPGRFGQTYFVGNPVRGTIRAFHKHDVLCDYFSIVSGSAKFAFVDDRDGGIEIEDGKIVGEAYPGSGQIVVISADQPTLIVVPPGVYHGWMSLEDNTLLCSTATELYNQKKPDELRVPPDSFDVELDGYPWKVEGR